MPTLLKGMGEPTYIYKGLENNLSCSFKSAPASEVSWFKDERPITTNGESGNLVLKNVQDQDSGDYRCIGANIKGNANSTATVYAIGKTFSIFYSVCY